MTLMGIARRWFRFRRLLMYATLIQNLMVFGLFFNTFGTFWTLTLLIPASVMALLIHRFDTKYGFPAEIEASLRDNPEWQRRMSELQNRLDAIQQQIQILSHEEEK